MFPQGGIHWDSLGETIVAQAVVQMINRNPSLHLEPIQFTYQITRVDPNTSDMDLSSLTEIFKPDLHFKVAQVRLCHNMRSPVSTMKLAVIGGSFNNNLTTTFFENKTFQQIDYYYYFKQHRIFSNEENGSIAHDFDPTIKSGLAPILSANIVILEENSSLTVSEHGQAFYSAMKEVGAVSS